MISFSYIFRFLVTLPGAFVSGAGIEDFDSLLQDLGVLVGFLIGSVPKANDTNVEHLAAKVRN